MFHGIFHGILLGFVGYHEDRTFYFEIKIWEAEFKQPWKRREWIAPPSPVAKKRNLLDRCKIPTPPPDRGWERGEARKVARSWCGSTRSLVSRFHFFGIKRLQTPSDAAANDGERPVKLAWNQPLGESQMLTERCEDISPLPTKQIQESCVLILCNLIPSWSKPPSLWAFSGFPREKISSCCLFHQILHEEHCGVREGFIDLQGDFGLGRARKTKKISPANSLYRYTGVPKNGWFLLGKILFKMDDLRVPPFQETSICMHCNHHSQIYGWYHVG